MNLLLELLTNLYDAVIGVLFVTAFCKISFEKWYFTVISCVFCFSISTFFTFFDSFSLLHSIIITFILYVYVYVMKPKNKTRFLLAPIVFEVTLFLVNTLFLTLFSYLFDSSVAELISSGSTVRYLTILFSKILLTTILFIILRFASFTSRMNNVNLILFLFSPVFTSYILYLFIQISMKYSLDNFTPYIITGVLGLAGINVFTIILFEISNRNAEAKLKLDLLENETNHEREHYQKLLEINEELHKTKHDLKNHLLYVQEIIDSNDIIKAEKYVKDLACDLQKADIYMVTGNKTLDYILASKVSDNKDITFICTGFLDNIGTIDNLDLAVVFGNLVDNAIEAVQKQNEKTIEVHLTSFNDYRNIIVSNPIEKSVLDDNPHLVTTKKDKLLHGWGLKSVRSIVQKYNGMFNFYEENQKFIVHIALPINMDGID